MFDLVIRHFKSNGVLYERGTVLTDPSLIRRYILKVREGKILQVDLLNEKSKYKFDRVCQRHQLDANSILTQAGIIQPSEPVENHEEHVELTPQQKSALTKKRNAELKKQAELAAE